MQAQLENMIHKIIDTQIYTIFCYFVLRNEFLKINAEIQILKSINMVVILCLSIRKFLKIRSLTKFLDHRIKN